VRTNLILRAAALAVAISGSAFAANRPVRLDYVKTGPGAGEIMRVANG